METRVFYRGAHQIEITLGELYVYRRIDGPYVDSPIIVKALNFIEEETAYYHDESGRFFWGDQCRIECQDIDPPHIVRELRAFTLEVLSPQDAVKCRLIKKTQSHLI